ncbi:type II toxin-antitoxin system RelE/ParE family toxin [Roseibium sp. AS2]|uniref:type II toxin-antitoxin system RelE/ParE family toxin n=1 Tax=Roseibium sp. AS2 TaxID=3135781 RepID=UPI003180D257
MKRFAVEYRETAVEDLEAIFEYVLEASRDAVTAKRYTDRIFRKCENIGDVPHGYPERNDLSFGIRLVPFEDSAVILYVIEGETVWITNIFAGGRDYDAFFQRQRDTD